VNCSNTVASLKSSSASALRLTWPEFSSVDFARYARVFSQSQYRQQIAAPRFPRSVKVTKSMARPHTHTHTSSVASNLITSASHADFCSFVGASGFRSTGRRGGLLPRTLAPSPDICSPLPKTGVANECIQSAVIGVQKYEVDDTLKTSGRYAAATTNSRTNTNPNLNTTPLT